MSANQIVNINRMSMSRHVVIAGQAAPDLFRFQPSALPGLEPASPHTEWFRGGVSLLIQLFKHLFQGRLEVEIHAPEFSNKQLIPSSLIELHQQFGSDGFTVERTTKLNIDTQLHMPESFPPPGSEHNRVVYVFQDGGEHFGGEDEQASSRLSEPHWPSYFIYKMSRPLCKGAVWEKIRPRALPGRFNPEHLVVIVHADDLRAEGIGLSAESSWESTCEDFVRNLGTVGSLITLVTCPHLIVVFGCDGVIYHRGLDVLKPVLFFNPFGAEDDFFNKNAELLPGIMEVFIAGFVGNLMQSDKVNYEKCIRSGLAASRRLARKGVSWAETKGSIYDFSAIFSNEGKSEDTQNRLEIPSNEIGNGEQNWSLLDFVVADFDEMARRIVLEGTSNIQIPISRINRLVLFSRKDIEAFHIVKIRLEEYLAAPQTKPLSIAFFGPRGAGKTFAALEVAEAAARGRKVRAMVFDMSDFRKLEDLIEALHRIRDCALDGYIPLVYFKSFDATFQGSPFGWLTHFLPVMAYGKFLEGGMSRPVGSAVLLFGSSITRSFANFTSYMSSLSPTDAQVAQDFMGCLQGYVDMAGINSSGGADKVYPFRRAIILRALLEEREPKLKSGDWINIDEGVLNGLLLVPKYLQGIRSLKAILAMSHLNNAHYFLRSALPSETELRLHVSHDEFMQVMSGKLLPIEVRESLAERLHEVYCKHIRARERAKPENKSKTDEQIDGENGLKPWNKLPEIFKESNRDHAGAISSTIRHVSCFLAEMKEGEGRVISFEKEEIEILAICEKSRWNSERLQRQWRMGPRSGKTRTTPYLVPWEDLDEATKDIDRAMVSSYPTILPPNYAIYKVTSRVWMQLSPAEVHIAHTGKKR